MYIYTSFAVKSFVHILIPSCKPSVLLKHYQMSHLLIKQLEELKVAKLIFIRHANAAPLTGETRLNQPHDWKFRDQIKALTSKGKEQASLSKSYLERFNVKASLTSPARRASDTAVIMSQPTVGGDIFLRMIESLHPADMSQTCEDLFDTLGYGPLRKFFEVEGGKGAFLDYAERVCAEITCKIGGPSFDRDAPDGDAIAVFGHAVFLNSIAYAVCASYQLSQTDDVLLDVDLGETQGILIDIENSSITILKADP
jgi:hypothetical protein